jgi:hypothetical protein
MAFRNAPCEAAGCGFLCCTGTGSVLRSVDLQRFRSVDPMMLLLLLGHQTNSSVFDEQSIITCDMLRRMMKPSLIVLVSSAQCMPKPIGRRVELLLLDSI